jgi:hypothetical protein
MKLLRIVPWLAAIFLSPAVCRAENVWQAGRISDVTQNTDRRTPSSIVSTPLTDRQTVCVISVHVGDKIYTGSYVESKDQPAPPSEWIKGYPVRVQFVGEDMILQVSPANDLKVKVSKRKSASKMHPLTPQEEAALTTEHTGEERTESVIGFDQSAPQAAPPQAEPEAASPPSSPQPARATVSVSSVPYLADLYVDGEDEGYTPAKLKLLPGKHILRCEKKGYQPWTKEITVSGGAELALDATLNPKK